LYQILDKTSKASESEKFEVSLGGRCDSIDNVRQQPVTRLTFTREPTTLEDFLSTSSVETNTVEIKATGSEPHPFEITRWNPARRIHREPERLALLPRDGGQIIFRENVLSVESPPETKRVRYTTCVQTG
jgi:hypothetical protein